MFISGGGRYKKDKLPEFFYLYDMDVNSPEFCCTLWESY